MHTFSTLTALPLVLPFFLTAGPADKDSAVLRFNRDVRPILAEKCFRCHGPDPSHRKAELRFDVREAALRDLGGYAAIVPGKPGKSALIERIESRDPDEQMPPPDTRLKLSAAEREQLRRWIAEGAKFERHWSYRPLRKPPLPPPVPAAGPVEQAWSKHPIDRRLLAAMRSQGVKPSVPADPVTLARRLSFDLTGLPPAHSDVKSLSEVTGAARDAAYEKLVDRLLASPHYGERMAMYWLDLVRYADTVGYHGDQDHGASPYRDWVIDSLNQNLPFDQFTIQQLAGDLLPDATESTRIASCYNRLLQTTHEGGAQDLEYRAKYAADRVRNFSAVWMGATVACAECHDHKYDPYQQKHFYQLAAFFADVQEKGNYGRAARPPEIEVISPLDRNRLAALDRRRAALDVQLQELRKSSSADGAAARVKTMTQQLKSLDAQRKAIAVKRRVMVTSATKPRTVRVLKRGNWQDTSGPIVEPGTPDFLPPLRSNGSRPTRLDLARWITSPEHPQTSRVFVNRIWSLLWGRGISATLNDNGSQSAWPTHPELLDHLAYEFVHSGWDIKRLVKQIVLSRAYRQSSRVSSSQAAVDPQNRMFARQSRFRLPAEMIRDNALRVSGLLNAELQGGRSRPYQPAGYYMFLNFPKRKYRADSDDQQYRRGVYMHWQRQFLHPMLRAFDAPTREECAASRPISNTPLAGLTLLNDPTFVEAARMLAVRALAEPKLDDRKRLAWIWREVLSRQAKPNELAVLTELLKQSRGSFQAAPQRAAALVSVGLSSARGKSPPAELAAWTMVGRALLNTSEFQTRN